MRLVSNLSDRQWAAFCDKWSSPTKMVEASDRDYFKYFTYLFSGNRNVLAKSTRRIANAVDSSVESSNVLWETPEGSLVLSRSKLRSILSNYLRLSSGRGDSLPSYPLPVSEALCRFRMARKVDYPKEFKGAVSFVEKEIKRLQKELVEGAPLEQLFSLAYENLVEMSPDLCVVWDKFEIAKGLKLKGWNVRASVPSALHRSAQSIYVDLAHSLQSKLGEKIKSHEFQHLDEENVGEILLHYGKEGKSGVYPISIQLQYGPSESFLEVAIFSKGKEVASFSEDNEMLAEDLLEKVVDEAHSRWKVSKSSAQFPLQDEANHSLPEALGPDRRGWSQAFHQVYVALRDFLRREVAFLPVKMFLWSSRFNQDTAEFTFTGDRQGLALYLTVSLSLEGDPEIRVESSYEGNGKAWTRINSFTIKGYDKTSEIVEDVQEYLTEELSKEIKKLSESPSTVENVLQRAMTSSLLR